MKKIVVVPCLLISVTLFAHDVYAEEAAVTEKSVAAGSAKQTGAADKKAGSAMKKPEPQLLKLAGGKLMLPVPGDWKSVKPRSQILKHEFSIAAKGDETPGRMTIMAAGGGLEANIARWVGQFQTPAGKPLGEDAKKIEKKKVGELEIHVVDLQGDFQDSMRGPFGPKVKRPGYRMLAMIIPLQKGGTWFVKFYGPQATVKAAEKNFAAMVEGVKFTP